MYGFIVYVALITRWKFGQSNRVAPSADTVICNKITILSSSSHPQNSCGSVCDVLPLLAGFHHDIKSYMQIYEYTTTHARTMHLLSLCNGAVFVLYLPSLQHTGHIDRTHCSLPNKTLDQKKHFPLFLLNFLLVIGKFLRSHYFVTFASRQPLPVAWQQAYMCEHIQNTYINSIFFTLTYLALTHFYPRQLTVHLWVAWELNSGNSIHDLEIDSEWFSIQKQPLT